jgi:hypothetical protein
MKFLEYQYGDGLIIAERKTTEGKTETDVRVIWQQADKINSNGRLYSRQLLQREIDEMSKRIKKGDTVWGQAFHPADGFGRPQNISHKWKKLWLDKDGVARGILTLVDTTSGRDMKALIKSGKIGISSRGFGNTIEKEKTIDGKTVRYLEVADDYKMETPGDFVVSPSVSGAGNVKEGLMVLEEKMNKYEDQEPEKKPKKKVTPADVWLEAKALGVPASEYARKINEASESGEEKASPLEEEARIAGFGKPGVGLVGIDLREKMTTDEEGDAVREYEKIEESAKEKIERIKKNLNLIEKRETKKKKPLTEEEKKAKLAQEKRLAGGDKVLIK